VCLCGVSVRLCVCVCLCVFVSVQTVNICSLSLPLCMPPASRKASASFSQCSSPAHPLTHSPSLLSLPPSLLSLPPSLPTSDGSLTLLCSLESAFSENLSAAVHRYSRALTKRYSHALTIQKNQRTWTSRLIVNKLKARRDDRV
jgi:hypothetical protein